MTGRGPSKWRKLGAESWKLVGNCPGARRVAYIDPMGRELKVIIGEQRRAHANPVFKIHTIVPVVPFDIQRAMRIGRRLICVRRFPPPRASR